MLLARVIQTSTSSYIVYQAAPVAITPGKIERSSNTDLELPRVRNAVLIGNRATVRTEYKHVWEKLTAVGHAILPGC